MSGAARLLLDSGDGMPRGDEQREETPREEAPAAPLPESTPAPPEGEPQREVPPAPEADAQSKAQKRFRDLTRERYAEQRRADEAEARVRQYEQLFAQWQQGQQGQQQPGQQYQPPQDPYQQGRMAGALEAREAAEAQALTERCNAIFREGMREYADEFGRDVQDLVGAGIVPTDAAMPRDPQGRALLEAIAEMEDGHRVYHALAQDLDEAQRIKRLSPVRMARALDRLAGHGGAPAEREPQAEPAQYSRAPAPIRRINGTSRAAPNERSESMADFMRRRDKEERETPGRF